MAKPHYVIYGFTVGVILIDAITYAFDALYVPSVLSDGQYILLMVVAAPLGGILGAITGLALAYYRERNWQTCYRLLVRGGLISLFVTVPACFFGAGISLVWSRILIFAGINAWLRE